LIYFPNNTCGWVKLPVTAYRLAGDYWLADGDQYTPSNTTFKYSIWGDFLTLALVKGYDDANWKRN